jgi:hypothetical protein
VGVPKEKQKTWPVEYEEMSELETGLRTNRDCPRCARQRNDEVKNASSVAAKYKETADGLTTGQKYDLVCGFCSVAIGPSESEIPQRMKEWRAKNAKRKEELKTEFTKLQANVGKYDCEKEYWVRADQRVDPKDK